MLRGFLKVTGQQVEEPLPTRMPYSPSPTTCSLCRLLADFLVSVFVVGVCVCGGGLLFRDLHV